VRGFLLACAVLLAALLVAGFFLPAEVRVEQEIVVQRPAATVFTLLNGFNTFERWSPLRAADPAVALERSGPADGAGARVTWSGDPALTGVGWREVSDSTPYARVDYRSQGGPEGAATSRVIIRGDALASRLTWSRTLTVSEGQGLLAGWLGRYFGWFLERWAREALEQELLAFKRFAEDLPAADFAGADIQRVKVAPQGAARVDRLLEPGATGRLDPAAVSAVLTGGFEEIARWAQATGAVLGQKPIAAREVCGNGTVRLSAVIPLAGPPRLPAPEDSPVRRAPAPAGPAARITHRGAYAGTQGSYERLEAWIAAHGLEATALSWERYLDDPATTAQDALRTEIYMALVKTGRDDGDAGSGAPSC